MAKKTFQGPKPGRVSVPNQVFLLDAAALLNNESFSFEGGRKYFTTPQVFSEWRDFRSRLLAENAAKSGALEIIGPSVASLEKCRAECKKTGTVFGNADSSIVALAIDFRESGNPFVVITDDYSVQNSLKGLGIKFIGVAQGEIKKSRMFGAGHG